MSLIVYTVILGRWDNLRPPATVDPSVRYLCFTDTPLPSIPPWELIPIYPTNGLARNRRARLPKILPHLLLPAGTDYSIYHDGSHCLQVAPRVLLDHLKASDLAFFPHPCRDCVYAEADILLRENIGEPALVSAQVASLRAESWPEHAGLWAGGVIVRRHSDEVRYFNECWWRRFLRGCSRDQMAVPPALKEAHLEPSPLRGDVYRSEYFRFFFHTAWKDRGDNPHWAPWREEEAHRERRLLELCQ